MHSKKIETLAQSIPLALIVFASALLASSSGFGTESAKGVLQQQQHQRKHFLSSVIDRGTSRIMWSRHYIKYGQNQPKIQNIVTTNGANLLSHPSSPPLSSLLILSSSSSNVDGDEKSGEQSVVNDDLNMMNGIYLNPETYLQAEDTILRPDGSLNLNIGRMGSEKKKKKSFQTATEGLFSPPPSYIYSAAEDIDVTGNVLNNEENTQRALSEEELLYQAVMEIENARGRDGTAADPTIVDLEALHREVFEEEEAYLQQSENFRKSLSSLFTSNFECPNSKERREFIEQYNEKVLSDLMIEMEGMEDMAISREDAMSKISSQERGNTTTTRINNDAQVGEREEVSCANCGLRVTSDMFQRAALIKKTKESRDNARANNGAFGMNRILCSACYGKRFVTAEAQLRVPAPEFASSRLFEKKSNSRIWSNSKQSISSWVKRGDTNLRGGGMEYRGSNIHGMSTASLINIPKGISARDNVKDNRSAPESAPVTKQDRTSSPSKSISGESSLDYRRREMFSRESSSLTLGGRELEKRMKRWPETQEGSKFSSSDAQIFSTVVPKRLDHMHTSEDGEEIMNDLVDLVSTDNYGDNDKVQDDPWVTVQDPRTERSFLWNTESGEMKKTQ